MSTDYLFPSPQTSTGNPVLGDRWNYHVQRINRTMPDYATIYKDGSTIYGYKNSDGSTISSNASAKTVIDAVMASANTAGGGSILIKKGTYDMGNASTTLANINNVWVRGEGMDITTLINGGFSKNHATATSNIRIADMTINCNSNVGTAIHLGINTINPIVERVKMMNSSSSFLFNWATVDRLLVDKCILIDGGKTVAADNAAGGQLNTNEHETIFRDCYFEKTTLSLGAGMLTTGGGGNLLVDGCYFIDSSAAGVSYAAVSVENLLSSSDPKDTRIVNCRAYGKDQGFMIGNGVQAANKTIRSGSITNCVSTGVQRVMGAKRGMISNGTIYDSRYGYFMADVDVAKISDSIVKNTNFYGGGTFDHAGVYADKVDYLEVDNVHVYDDSGTTPHGIRFTQTGTTGNGEAYITNCVLIGPFTGDALIANKTGIVKIRGGRLVGTFSTVDCTTLTIRDVTGYVTEAQGTGTITSALTSATVTHGLSYTPTAAEIDVKFTENPTTDPGNWWPSAIGATTFVVNVRTAPGATNLDFSWAVRRI